MPSATPAPDSPKRHLPVVLLGPVGLPLLIAFECGLQSMILFEGLFLAAFLVAVGFALRPFLASRLGWPANRLEAWEKATVFGTVVGALFTLIYALRLDGGGGQAPPADVPATTAQYLTVAVVFPLILGAFQARAAAPCLRIPALWPLVPAVGCLIGYGASQLIELLEAFDRSGLITLVLTLVAAFLITYWVQRAGLMLLRRTSAGDATP
jgi:hypothetical protein